jgi:hypothetical protein
LVCSRADLASGIPLTPTCPMQSIGRLYGDLEGD